ncbi:MAG: thiol oxidoreductase [Deltaproteobacteria bacterium]|nr:thiol oxidoreductase [Deltaproteobacteria bacterium]
MSSARERHSVLVPSSRLVVALALSATCAAVACDDGDVTEGLGPEVGAELLGGETTVFDESPSAFSRPARNLTPEERDVFALGDHFFNRNWVAAPASTAANDGLGPLFNALGCSACHLHDGRSAPPLDASAASSGLLLRLSIPGEDEHGGPRPEPTYGGQLQPLANVGVPAEGRYTIGYDDLHGSFADGEPYVLQAPRYTIAELGYGPLSEGTMLSPRTAPAMIGLGLLEAIPEETIRALADPNDLDGDGVSGRVNEVWDPEHGRTALGRFGWKANVPSIAVQVAGAFNGDLGITSSVFPREGCTASQRECEAAPTGGSPELAEDTRLEVTRYSQALGVPARRRTSEPLVLRGERLFAEAGCSACHVPKLVTGEATPILGLRRQTIRPYTDLLLHDMGPELADGRPDFQATGSEWRTPPLWGLGLLSIVSKHTRLLHDGRARDVSEAILWHGGEATASREAFRAMPRPDRVALLAFLGSL